MIMHKNFFLLLCWVPLALFAEKTWTFGGLDELIRAFECEKKTLEISFTALEPVSIRITYPVFSARGLFGDFVNRRLEADATTWFHKLVKDEQEAKELWDGTVELGVNFSPVYQTTSLLSIFICKDWTRGDRGSSGYGGRTFWQRKDSVEEVQLSDLFSRGSKYREFLLQYCENAFKTSKYGYYSYEMENFPELTLTDFETFVLTDKGL